MNRIMTIWLLWAACVLPGAVWAQPEPVTKYCRDDVFAVPFSTFDLGAGKVETVQLFYRRKGQDGWKAGGISRDGNPISFKPPADGTWQFMTRGIDAAGNMEEKDQVELEVIFDRTPPRVAILEPRPGEVIRAGTEIKVSWTIEDEHASPTGSALYGVEDPNSSMPWHILSRPAPLRGAVAWRVPEVPRGNVTLTLESIDRAGNVASTTVPLKVVNERVRPTDRLRPARKLPEPKDVTPEMKKLARQLAEMAMTLEAKGEIVKAEASLARAMEINPYDVAVVLRYTKFLAERDRTDDAITILERAGRTSPDQIDLHFALAELYWQTDRHELATIAYKKVIQTDANTRNVHVAYRRLIGRAVQQQRNEEAINLIARYLDTAKMTDTDRRNLLELRRALRRREAAATKPGDAS